MCLPHTSSIIESKSRQTLWNAFTVFMNGIKYINPCIPSKSLQFSYQKLPYKTFTDKKSLNMPLVVPGINSGGDASKTEEWQNKLVGKKLGEGASDEVVRYSISVQVNKC